VFVKLTILWNHVVEEPASRVPRSIDDDDDDVAMVTVRFQRLMVEVTLVMRVHVVEMDRVICTHICLYIELLPVVSYLKLDFQLSAVRDQM